MLRQRSRGERRVDLAESIVYVCALIADQPRAIDRYIDYFGETRSVVGVAPLASSGDERQNRPLAWRHGRT
jgi:hypothetical protein